MSTLELTRKIEMLPQEEYAMVETYVNRISEFVAKKQQEKAWSQLRRDLVTAEKSIHEEGTISYDDMRKSLGVQEVASVEFSKIVQSKLAELQIRLIEIGGEKKGKERMAKVMSAVGNLELFPNAGIPITIIYDVESEFEKYHILYAEKNYFFYYIENDVVYIVEMYDEREDIAAKFLGIHTTLQETLDYWDE